MKKVTLILAIVLLSMTIFSCSNNESKKTSDDSKMELKNKKTEKENPLLVILSIGDSTLKYDNSIIRNMAMTPSEKSDDYELCCGATTENGGECIISLEFTTEGATSIKNPYIKIKGYKVIESLLTIDKFETTVKKLNGIRTGTIVKSINANIVGKIRKDNGLGNKLGEIEDFTISLIK